MVGAQEHRAAATVVTICSRRATSPTGSAGGNVGIVGSASCFFNFCKRSSPSATPCASTSLSCSAFRNASLAAAMVASCCQSRFFDLAKYASVARICFSNGSTCACRVAFSHADCKTCHSSVSSGWSARGMPGSSGSLRCCCPQIAPGTHSGD